jgi:hypothetical protein
MKGSPRLRLCVLALSFVLILGASVGSVWAAQRGGEGPADLDRMQQAIDAADMIRVADVPAADGESARGVFVQELATGHVCIWDAPSAISHARQGGCNPSDDPLGGAAVNANLAYDGGPAVEAVRDARLSGLARPETVRLVVQMTDGSTRSIRMRKVTLGAGDFVAFGYRFKKADLKKGIGPIAVVAFDASGNEIGRQTTGIG